MIDFTKEKNSIRLDFIDNFKEINIIPIVFLIFCIMLIKAGHKNLFTYALITISIWYTLKQIDFLFVSPIYWFVYKNPRYYYTDLYKFTNEDFLNTLVIRYIIIFIGALSTEDIKMLDYEHIIALNLLTVILIVIISVCSLVTIIKDSIRQINDPDYMVYELAKRE